MKPSRVAMRMVVLYGLYAVLLITLAARMFGDEYQGLQGHWVDAVATAYSPHDDIDGPYRAQKGDDLFMTAGRVSDVRVVPYGIAAPNRGPLSLPLRTRVIVPAGTGYVAEGRVLLVDDTGGVIRRRTRDTGRLHIDLRVRTQAEARTFGKRTVRIFVVEGP